MADKTAYLNLLEACESQCPSKLELQKQLFREILADGEPLAGFARAFARHKKLFDAPIRLAIPGLAQADPIVEVHRPNQPLNPFTQTAAIHEPSRFIGREKLLQRLRRSLEGGNVALIGPAKIGKSSLLYQLKQTWQGDVIGPIDFQGVSGKDDFLAQLAAGLGLAKGSDDEIRDAFKQRRLLLLLDEIEYAPTVGISVRVMTWLRAICNASPGVSAVIAGQKPIGHIFEQGEGSDWDNIFSPFPVSTMTEAEARVLLAHPWLAEQAALPEEVVAEIIGASACHPFWLQRGGYHAFEGLHDPDYDWRGELAREKGAGS